MSRPLSPLRHRLVRSELSLLVESSSNRPPRPSAALAEARRLLAQHPAASTPGDSRKLVADLETLPDHASRLRLVLKNPTPYTMPPVVRRLVERSETNPSADHRAAESFARLGLLGATLLPDGHSGLRQEALLRGHLALANALRMQVRFDEAHRFLEQARHLLPSAPSPRLAIPFRLRSASLAFYQMDYPRALRHLDRAQDFIRHDDALASRVYALRAWIVGASGNLGRALTLLRRAVPCAQPATYMDFLATDTLVKTLLRAGRSREAARLFEQSQHLYSTDIHPMLPVQRAIFKGMLAFHEQRHDSALRLLRVTCEECRAQPGDTLGILLTLYIAQVLAFAGRHREATHTFRAIYPELSSLILLPPLRGLLASLEPVLTDDHSPLVPSLSLENLISRLTYTPLIPAPTN